MISHTHKCIFIHCKKCAGESVEKLFTGKADNNFNGDPFEGSPSKHWGVSDYMLHHPREFQSYYKFSIVRNPWDRIISWTMFKDQRYNRTRGSFLDRLKKDLSRNYEQYKEKSYKSLLFIDKKLMLDNVIKFEELNIELPKLIQKFNLPVTEVPHENKITRKPYWEYYDIEARKLVHDIFYDDIKYFNYKFHKSKRTTFLAKILSHIKNE